MNIRSRSPKTGVQKRCLPNQAYKRYNTANFFLYNTFENQKKGQKNLILFLLSNKKEEQILF